MIFLNHLCYPIGNNHLFQKGLIEEGRFTLSVGGTTNGVGFQRGWREESKLSISVSLSLPPDHRWVQCEQPPHTPSCRKTFPEAGAALPNCVQECCLNKKSNYYSL